MREQDQSDFDLIAPRLEAGEVAWLGKSSAKTEPEHACLYDNIGRAYSGRRQSDPRIAAAIETALGGCASVLNIGAGTGSYEPISRLVAQSNPPAR